MAAVAGMAKDSTDARSNTGGSRLALIPESPESASVIEVMTQPAPWSELQVKTLFSDRRTLDGINGDPTLDLEWTPSCRLPA